MRSTTVALRSQNRFVLEAVDPATRCVAKETSFVVPDPSALRDLLNIRPDDFTGGAAFDLDDVEAALVVEAYGVQFTANGLLVTLRQWCAVDELPYKVHTDRELAMMLEGQKPLAAFSDAYPSTSSFEVPERTFEPYVTSGRFMKREEILPAKDAPGQRYEKHATRLLLYALPQEQWRIDAYILLKKTAQMSGWNEGFERMEGTLLGYTDEQNDIYIEMIYRNHIRALPGHR